MDVDVTFHEDERTSPEGSMLALLRRLWPYVLPHKLPVLGVLLLLPAMASLALVPGYLMKLAVDTAIAPPDGLPDLARLNLLGVLFVAALVAEFSLSYVEVYLLQLIGQRITAQIRLDLFTHLQGLGAHFFNRNPVGRLMSRTTNDTEGVSEMFTSGIITIAGDLLTLSFLLAMMVYLSPIMAAWVVCFIVPVLVLLVWIFQGQERYATREIRKRIAAINAYMQEVLNGLRVAQLFRREARNDDEFYRLNVAHMRAWQISARAESFLYAVVECLASVAVALVVWQASGQILAGIVTLGTLVAFIEYIQRFFVPIEDLSSKYAVLVSGLASLERIFGLLDEPPEVISPRQPAQPAACRGDIRYEGVSFSYKPGEPVLQEVDLHITPGQKLAIVGATGAGKTTLAKLLNRTYDPTAGRVLLDGVDLRDYDLPLLRRRVAVVQQDVFLFSTTVAHNISLGDPAITRERVEAAARRVHADLFVERLSRGYDEEVRDGGANFSSGQRQLLAFARALAYDAPVLILDEATSSVDTETEHLIQEALRVLLEGRTSLVVAHRLSTIRNADRIVVMHQGRIRETGSHDELLARGGIYHRLHALQYDQTPAGH